MTAPVLVTGSNRSGTTWVGRMLCASGDLTYLHEPFNPGYWPRTLPDLPHRNLYVCQDNERRYLRGVEDLLGSRFPVRAQLGQIRSARDAARLARDAGRAVRRRSARKPLLVKDPIALFSAEWLAERFGLRVVVMVRQPVAYAGSIKRLGWAFDFRNWSEQPLLLRDLLLPFAEEIGERVENPGDLVDQAILQWNCQYHAVDTFRRRHPEWIVVTHESLASDPLGGFEALYGSLGLRYTRRARREVERTSATSNVKDVPAHDKGTIRRDSRATRDTWRSRLTPDEVDRVREATRRVARAFYDEEERAAS